MGNLRESARKAEQAMEELAALGSVAVAFSAGVDSAVLLDLAHEALGDKAIAITAMSVANPQREKDEARAFCRERGIRHIAFDARELDLPDFELNPPDRCYRCKVHLFSEMKRRAREEGVAYVVEGSNVDDLDDYRPGRRALEELSIRSPLLDAGLTKAEIREVARSRGLAQWDKPSFACLYTRFPYGSRLTPERVRMVDDAEQFLLDNGFSTVRVRMVDDVARIELDISDLPKATDSSLREQIVARFKSIGFSRVTLDLEGYRTGSMNEM